MELTPNTNNTPAGIQLFTVTGNWEEQSKQLKRSFSQLTDGDLRFETGRENELLIRMQSRLNKQRQEVIAIIKQNQQDIA